MPKIRVLALAVVFHALAPVTIADDNALVESLLACCRLKGHSSIEECDKDAATARDCIAKTQEVKLEQDSRPVATEDSSGLRTFGSSAMESMMEQVEGLPRYQIKAKKKEKGSVGQN